MIKNDPLEPIAKVSRSQFRQALVGLSIVIMVVAVGCATAPTASDFEKVLPPMAKPDVLDILGPPHLKTRKKGTDIWLYRLWNKTTAEDKEVHFVEGKVVYVGLPRTPQTDNADQSGGQDPQASEDSAVPNAAATTPQQEIGKPYEEYILDVEKQRRESRESFEELP